MESIIRNNYESVCGRIASACARVGRHPGEVTLVAVTKYAEWIWVEALAGFHRTFGESRPQQLAERQPRLPNAEWHLIGQLQRNKARLAVQHADMVHSVDSTRLLARLADLSPEISERPGKLRVLLEVNLSGEDSKSGFAADVLRELWPELDRTHRDRLKICGLMTMAGRDSTPDACRAVFRGLAGLRRELNAATEDAPLKELSMGMSDDFEVAIEEGATLIRVGSALFTGLSA